MHDQFLCFRLDGEWYLHDIAAIREIAPYQASNPLPGGSTEALGIQDIRGSVITVFSGRALLSLPDAADSPGRKIIIFDSERGSFGVAVDAVAEIARVDCSQLDHPSEGGRGGMIQGTLSHDGKLFILIDFIRCAEIDLQ